VTIAPLVKADVIGQVMKGTTNTLEIDAVITWVDGADPKHAAKLNTYLESLGGRPPRAASKTRFHDSGELDYCVTSILKFAPWIRTIFIVTDDQIPSLMEEIKGTEYQDRIQIIDHKTIFKGYENCLPTFNSSSILNMLWRIPGLAEHFIFFNDDFVIVRPVYPEDFFRDDKVVLRGQWFSLLGDRMLERIKKLNPYFGIKEDQSKARPGHRERQKMAAMLLGYRRRYFRLPHNPHAWRVSTQRKFFEESPSVLAENICYPLRSPNQYVVEALAAHLEFKKGDALVDNNRKNVQLKPAEQFYLRIKYKLAQANRNNKYIFCCVQSIESASSEKQKLIFSWLDERVGCLKDLLTKYK
jgi:Stealth protein CR2, conserved region 2/Stealth protein CR1, conserved region 1